jgi:hypothetical protein
MRLCLRGTAVANVPIVHAPDNTCVNMEMRWDNIGKGKQKNSEKSLIKRHFINTNATWSALGTTTGSRGEQLGFLNKRNIFDYVSDDKLLKRTPSS